jgi:hypothetical protein
LPDYKASVSTLFLLIAERLDDRKKLFVGYKSPMVVELVFVDGSAKFCCVGGKVVVTIRELTSLKPCTLPLAVWIAAIHEPGV